MSPDEAAQFVDTHRDTIDRMIEFVARRRALSIRETERFAAQVEMALAAEQYRIVRNFRGRSTPAAYLAVVIWSLAPRSRRATFKCDETMALFAELPRTPSVRTPLVASEGPPPPRDSEWRVLASGIVVGTARFDALHGLLAVPLVPTTAFAMVVTAAQSLGQLLRETSYWAPGKGDLAAALAARWSGATLHLTNLRGESVPTASIVVVDTSPCSAAAPPPSVVLDFRLSATAVPAVPEHSTPAAPEGAQRPAA